MQKLLTRPAAATKVALTLSVRIAARQNESDLRRNVESPVGSTPGIALHHAKRDGYLEMCAHDARVTQSMTLKAGRPPRRCHFVFVAVSLLAVASCARPNGETSARRPFKISETSSKTGVEMVVIPGGEFLMGSTAGSQDESPRHAARVLPLVMDKFEVTQTQFAALELPDPSQFKSPDRPVEQIRWVYAAEYCNERSKAEGLEPCYDE